MFADINAAIILPTAFSSSNHYKSGLFEANSNDKDECFECDNDEDHEDLDDDDQDDHDDNSGENVEIPRLRFSTT